MQVATILYLILALIISLSAAYFQYFYKVEGNKRKNLELFILRFLSLFLLGIVLINPTFTKTEITEEKPILAVLVDNSESIKHFNQTENIKKSLKQLKNHEAIQQKFEIKYFTFGNHLSILDSTLFNESHTNISSAITEVNELYKEKSGAILLLSDGNQTIGNTYEFINSKKSVYPVVIGDTTKFKDLKISQLNVNKYSFLNNIFPVETFLNYEGAASVTRRFSIFNNGKRIFSKRIKFSQKNTSQIVLAELKASKEGQNYYTASIEALNNEKNTENNLKPFSVEIINEQTKILILASTIHPDLGAFKKAIERNKQRAATIKIIDDFDSQLLEYQLVILYQPTLKFNKILEVLKQNSQNYFVITGANTDWNFINNQPLGFSKKAIQQTEKYSASFNTNYLTFLQKNIDFNQFPPLKDKFGAVKISKPFQPILYQQINGVETNQPLLATLEDANQKTGVLFGEGFWKWRAQSFLATNSFEDFDEFTGNLMQFLVSTKKRNRLEVTTESIYPANSTLKIAAFYTDKNYKFDNRAALKISITNLETKEVKKLPFSLITNSYQVEIENLIGGDYAYKVVVEGQKISKTGRFKIVDYKIEEQFTNANFKKLLQLSERTNGELFFQNNFSNALKSLSANENFFTIQKSIHKKQQLIDWKLLLFFVIGLLSVEWFLRKYLGKV